MQVPLQLSVTYFSSSGQTKKYADVIIPRGVDNCGEYRMRMRWVKEAGNRKMLRHFSISGLSLYGLMVCLFLEHVYGEEKGLDFLDI